MANNPMDDQIFEQLLCSLNQETRSTEGKLDILFRTRGYYSALQASTLLYSFNIPSDKVRAIHIVEPRLCRMTCSEARDVIGSCSIPADKLKVLNCVKRYLVDNATREGQEQILCCFPFEHDKYQAVSILHTVRSDVANRVSAGGHQGYAALGGLYTQNRPLEQHLYGDVQQQFQQVGGKGEIQLPAAARYGIIPSQYTGHPSYAYPSGRNYATENRFPINDVYNDSMGKPPVKYTYPSGAPPLHMHQGGAHAVGFQ